VIYELRVYRCMPGRLPDLLKRFEAVTLKIWERHGIRQVGFWTTLVGDNNQELHYMLEWKDMAERERIWGAFMADAEWIKARGESEKNGPILAQISNSMLAPTAFSKLK
jgi:hypothetical protein